MLQQAAPEFTLALVGLVFSEGLLAFLSPCILPMLPIYLMYLGGSREQQTTRRRMLQNLLGFIAGFTVVFVLLGATASGVGALLKAHRVLLMRLGGAVLIVLGLQYCGVLNLAVLNRTRALHAHTDRLKFFSSLLFGAAFSLGWTPCLGPFLGSALLLASGTSTLYEGVLLLFLFSMGLGIPFLLTGLLWNRLEGTVSFLKKHAGIIKIISGCLLIVMGILMLFNLFGYYENLFS
ncbi:MULTISPECIES: cytochrome c biogenesis CcdA family protein [Caproicibacterium]|uniref:Cytochrome c biogenesis CcdA family protein n=1 Tax=Caproicibacterium argilliputei TaxID=3030016 RepID=A0AA97H4A9_9FIRM|nr:cytochrome c biogenesis CcdA family protein [Caproicibacterium argilliputei]WOC33198.1 cytochrome c biogenesis CcdA family protein [Caproicibacterium argilliputei]